ncbi:MAG: DUF4266 domain-containing protein [Myxococcales bacterium]|nr:DUF4266 domain-containing protein [Myxococcales bacterium]
MPDSALPRLRVLVLGVPLASAACVTVTPAERQQLSTPEMTPATDGEEEVWHTHVETAREAGFGGHGAAGGGCGCG